MNGPTNRADTIAAILKGDSLRAFNLELEDARGDPDPNAGGVPLLTTVGPIETALKAVAEVVIPFHAMETQKQWMTCSMPPHCPESTITYHPSQMESRCPNIRIPNLSVSSNGRFPTSGERQWIGRDLCHRCTLSRS